MNILTPVSMPQDGSIWAGHWTMPANDADQNWGNLRTILDRAGLAQLSEGGALITKDEGRSSSSLRWIRGKKGSEEGLVSISPPTGRANILHWYTEHASQDDIRSHVEWLIRKLEFAVVDDPLQYEFPNEGAPHGHTFSYLLADGCYSGLARHIILAESHLAVGPHLSVHTFPEEEGGVVFCTLVTWDHLRFIRIQSKLSRWGFLSMGIAMGGQFPVKAGQDFYTLTCCSEPKYEEFMAHLMGDPEHRAQVVFPGCNIQGKPQAAPLPLARALLRSLPLQTEGKQLLGAS